MRLGPILTYVIGMAFFCAMDAFMKHLVGVMPASAATFWRYAAAFVFVIPFWLHAGRPAITREMLPINILRAVFGSISAVLFFWSLTVLPLAEAVTIAFVAPLMIPLLAAVLLREKLQASNLAAGAFGFAGVLVAAGIDPAMLAPERLKGIGALLLAALFYALVIIITRLRAAKDGPSVLTLLNAAFAAILIGGFVVATQPPSAWLPPTPLDWLAIAGVGLTGAVALQLIAVAYAKVEAQVLAPFEYTALPWAALFGYAFFAEPVALRTWLGAAIIIAACLWQSRRQTPDLSQPQTPAA
ncbi:DMT family transporter [Sandaracinobacteroides saxicola]|uniref:DMT family transporter n=1 Tax=Sandaracinobacteroides saxicola TaxID=2759707 RepID=A0A7G5IH04_9SPHN|nr:DMT family transporter [Sandaracinobacteroides saxicola]QMW22646.1 DMT family transporter [Sandaracinobacteroides saxicola]